MTWCVERRHVEVSDPNHVVVAQLWVPADRGVMRFSETLCKRKVIRVRMGHKDDPDGRSREALVDGGEMSVVIRAGVDHHHHRSRIDDPGVGTGSGVRPGVRRDDSVD